MPQKSMSFRPRDNQQRADLALLCFVLDMDISKTLRLAVDSLLPSEKRTTVTEIAPHKSREVMSFRPRDKQQAENFEWLSSELELDTSKVIRLAIDQLIKQHRKQMDSVQPLYEAAQGALEQARQSLQHTDWTTDALDQAQRNLKARQSLQEGDDES